MQDEEHVRKHQNDGILCQPVMQCLAESKEQCIHYRRAMRESNKSTISAQSLKAKQILLATKAQDEFAFISLLDRAHTALLHSENEIASKIEEDKERMKRLPTYNAGIFVDYGHGACSVSVFTIYFNAQ